MFTMQPETDKFFASFLRDNGILTSEQFDQATNKDSTNGQGVIYNSLMSELISEDAVSEGLASFYGLKKSTLDGFNPAERPLPDRVNDNYIQKNRTIPFAIEGDVLKVAVADPDALNNANDLTLMTGCSIEIVVINLGEFEMYLNAVSMGMSMGSSAGDVSVDGMTPVDNDIIEEIVPSGAAHEVVQQEQEGSTRNKDRPKSDVINFVNDIIMDAVVMGASDIHIEAYREHARVRFRRDGVLQEMKEYQEFLSYNYSAVTTRIKILALLDISERRLPQDGGISSDKLDKAVDIRVSVLPASHGERVVMRILDPDAANFTLEELGMPADDLVKLRKAIRAPQGMILVTGPTGSGKSTTLYGVLKELNDGLVNILTAEDPVEYDLFGVAQVQVRDNIGFSFSAALRSFLRQDPEIIMVGEIRDKETSDIAIKAALTGHLVLSTLHTNDAPSTITRLLDMGVPPYLVNSAVSLVLAQRLARTNCSGCRGVDDSVSDVELIAIGFDEGNLPEPMVGKGCGECMDSGIKGRRAIHEVLPVSPNIRKAIFGGVSDSDIREIAQKEGFKTMQEVSRGLIASGDISVAEYKRILVLD